MNNLVTYGKEKGLARIDLKATAAGLPIYKKLVLPRKKHDIQICNTECKYFSKIFLNIFKDILTI